MKAVNCIGLLYMLICIEALEKACSVKEIVRNVRELILTCSIDNLKNSMTEKETFSCIEYFSMSCCFA